MIVIRTGDEKAEILRNKRRGWKLITKRVKPESTKNRCIWCSLRFDPACNPYDSKNPRRPCEDFLPDNVFFEDAKNNTRRRRKSKVDPK
jgi:hypothetical protein